MIISASRRTDIPTYYSKWLVNRLKAGYVLVRNPMNPHLVSRVALNPDAVDGLVLWTKNPLPMMDKLQELEPYPYYFQFTLNAYGTDIERNVPSKSKVIIPAFLRLADAIGADRVIWRYDPILLNDTYTVEYHIRYFEQMAKRLYPYTRRCTISFLDLYRKIEKSMADAAIRTPSAKEREMLAKALSQIAHSCGLAMDTCAEEIDLDQYAIAHAHCIDGELFERITGGPFKNVRDRNQRAACGCIASIDIGAYDTCRNGCRYCYANHGLAAVAANSAKHNPESPLLFGELVREDRVVEREMYSCKNRQTLLNL